ncbi:MAG: ATP-dependent RecD-like DNA helicase [Desulfatibacillaceae bacterium]|nr:ATP-dependent RecD-like DNA helicase [Desulfatibacillaceae bacterium]
MPKIEGRVCSITYFNEENLFVIARLDTKEGIVPILGSLGRLNVGERLRLEGRWETHDRFGEQFRVESYSVIMPGTLDGIKEYLGSGMIKGIGPALASRVVDYFGEDTITILDTEPKRLLNVHGIGPSTLKTIMEDWQEKRTQRETMMFLSSHGIGPGLSSRIFEAYGPNAAAVLRENPYRLALEVSGFGFATADAIGSKLGIPKDAPARMDAGVLHALGESASDGHFYLPQQELARQAANLLDADESVIQEAISRLAGRDAVILDRQNSPQEPDVYLPAFFHVERGLARRIRAFLSVPFKGLSLTDKDILEKVHNRLAIALSDQQLEVAHKVTQNRFSVITGGPGTGKTTLVRSILQLYDAAGQRVMLAAPTGRAAKRLGEVTGREATTIHRLLHYDFMRDTFLKNEDDPLDTEVVIIDEASMVDTFLAFHLQRAIPMTAVLILVGDVSQLPPVGPGNALKDIIASGLVPVFKLSRIFRQVAKSLIVQNAHRVNQGLDLLLEAPGQEAAQNGESQNERPDFYFIAEENPQHLVNKTLALCKERIPSAFGLDPMTQIQVLTPMHKGPAGTINLNNALQEALNPAKFYIEKMGRRLKVGDKVMQLKNNYSKEVFNGDIGTIKSIEADEGLLTVAYDNQIVGYSFAELDEITLAYAISVHKSQGSEYPAVILLLSTSHFVMLQRNLLYTGITRAKQLLVLVGSPKAVSIAIANNTPSLRRTRLTQRLQQE